LRLTAAGGELQLPEPLLETVLIAAGEIIGLQRHLVALKPAPERADALVDSVEIAAVQPRQLLEPRDAELIVLRREFRSNALQLRQVVGRA
jgi:hypothetical protein